MPPAKRRLDSDLDPAAPVIIFSGSGLEARLINYGLTLAQAEEAVAALEQLGSADESIAEAAALSVAELGRAPLVVALCDTGAVTAAIAAHRTHASNLRIACCMASFLDAALNAKADVSGEAAAAAVDGCLSALRHHAADRQLAGHAWSAIGALLARGGDSAVVSFRHVADAGVRTLQVLGSDVEVCRAACDAMSCLVKASGEAAEAARAAGLAEVLLQLLERDKESPSVCASCCSLLGASKSAVPGVAKAVVDAMTRHKDDDDVAAACGDAIAQLAVTPAAIDELLAAGAGGVLVAALQREGSTALSLAACCAAARCLAAQGRVARLLSAGAAFAIASAVASATDQFVAASGLSALRGLQRGLDILVDGWADWCNSRAEHAVLSAVTRFKHDSQCVRLCCELLGWLADDTFEGNEPALQSAALASVVAAALHPSDTAVQVAACEAIYNAVERFSSVGGFLDAIVQSGACALLRNVVSADMPQCSLRHVAVIAEALLSCPLGLVTSVQKVSPKL